MMQQLCQHRMVADHQQYGCLGIGDALCSSDLTQEKASKDCMNDLIGIDLIGPMVP